MTTTFDIHGRLIRVNSEVPRASEMLSERLGSYTSSSSNESSLVINIEPAPGELQINVRQDMRWYRSRPFWGDICEERLRLTDGASLAIVDHRARTAQIHLHENTLHDESFASRTFLSLPVLELLRTQGLFYIHGALVKKSDRSILILGKGGSGKSTLAMSLLPHGWRIIADDNLLMDLRSIELFPFEREVRLSPELATTLGLPTSDLEHPSKIRIAVSDLPAEWTAPSTHVTDIVLLEQQETIGLTDISRAALFQNFIAENPMILAVPALASLAAAALKTLLARAKCSRLHFKHHDPIEFDNLGLHFQQVLVAQK